MKLIEPIRQGHDSDPPIFQHLLMEPVRGYEKAPGTRDPYMDGVVRGIPSCGVRRGLGNPAYSSEVFGMSRKG